MWRIFRRLQSFANGLLKSNRKFKEIYFIQYPSTNRQKVFDYVDFMRSFPQ